MSGKNKDARSTTPSTAARRAAVLGENRKRKAPLIAAIAAAVALAAAGLYLAAGKGSVPGGKAASASAGGTGEFAYDVGEFSDGKARFFSYRTPDGLAIRYFILRSSDGVIRAAFDSCDTCWSAGKGYRQEGDLMVCNNCGLKFPSVRINEVRGGCNPAPLTRTVVNGKVIIKASDLIREGSFYFDFDGRGRS